MKIVGIDATVDGIRVLLEAKDVEQRLGILTAGVLWALVQTRPATWDGMRSPLDAQRPRPDCVLHVGAQLVSI